MNTSAAAQATPSVHAFTQQASDATHHASFHAIFLRRDVRGQCLLTPMPTPDEVLCRTLAAAHIPRWA